MPDLARKSRSARQDSEVSLIATDIPARLDRLPWSSFHWLVVLALGASWAIDGLEVTLTGAVSGVLQYPATLGLASGEIGALGSF